MDRISIITLALAEAFTKSTVAALEQVVRYIGVTTTAISDGSTTNPITINGQSVTVVAGDTVFYNGTSYAWDGSAWQEVMNIAEIITAVEALGGKVHDILGDIAPEFNSASSYAVDDVVLYEDDLYIFTSAHTGAWDSGDVTVTSIAQIVDDLRAEITSTNTRVSALETHVTQSGDVIDSDNHSLHDTALAIETEKTVSGNPITITDALPYNAVSLSAEIEAEQDLHGYDKPWVGGAGKNKFNPNQTPTPHSAYGFWDLGMAANTHLVMSFVDKTPSTPLSNDISIGFSYGLTNGGAQPEINDGYIWVYKQGAIQTDTSNYDSVHSVYCEQFLFYPKTAETLAAILAKFDIQIEIGDTVTSFAPYSNICPVSGRTAVAVDDLPNADYAPFFEGVKNGTYGFVDLGTLEWTFHRASGAYSDYFDTSSIADIKKGVSTVASNMLSYMYESIPSQSIATSGYDDKVMAVASNTNRFIACNKNYTDAATFKTAMNGVYLIYELATPTTPSYTAEQWAALVNSFGATNVTIQLGQTVYGGTVNVTTGVMTVTHNIITIDGNTNIQTNGATSESSRFGLYVSDKKNGYTNILSNIFITNLSAIGSAGTMLGREANTFVEFCLPPDVAQTVEAGQAWFGDNNTQLCYELATPTTIQLTPEQLTMLKGYNRLSSDSGDITLTYRANKVDSVQAEVDVLETAKADNADMVDFIENGNTASRAYSANQFMLWKGDLYKVITSIASGATITSGTNVSKTTIGAVLTAILNA